MMRGFKLNASERLQTRQANDAGANKPKPEIADWIRIGRERERQLIAEAERIAERRRG